MREELSTSTVPAVLGGGATTTGTYLPWFRVDPLYDPISVTFPLVYDTLAEPGVHGVHLVLLGIVATVVSLQVLDIRGRILSLLTPIGGIGIVLYCFHYLLFSAPIGFRGEVVPVSGWYLTVLGGLLFAGTRLLQPATQRGS